MPFKRWQTVCLILTLLPACIVPEPAVRPQTFDFGPPPGVQPARPEVLPVLQVSDVQAPRWLDGNYVQYRLAYVDAQSPRPYANSRWAMPPAQLLSQRLRSRLAQQGAVVTSGDAQSGMQLKTELEQFDQVFDSATASRGVVRLRATLIRDHRLLAQKTFSSEQPAATADAAGGVRALTQASDALFDALAAWVAEQR